MPTRIPWRSLLPGIIALCAIIATALGVVFFAGVGKIRGEKVQFYVRTTQARGIMRGSEVWLAGQKVGTVDRVDFSAPGADTTTGRVVIQVSVKASEVDKIRRDSYAQIRAGANIIGPIVVYLSSGSAASPAVRAGDTLRARGQSDFELAGAKLSEATADLGPMMADARTVMSRVRDPNGTIGAALSERAAPGGGRLGGEIARLRAQMSRFSRRTTNGNGGEHTKAAAATLMSTARGALARADSVRALVSSGNGSLGRFRRDSTLGAAVDGIRAELATLRARMDAAEGNMNRLAADSAITRAVAQAQNEMSLLFADIRRRPSRYIVF